MFDSDEKNGVFEFEYTVKILFFNKFGNKMSNETKGYRNYHTRECIADDNINLH